ncbi:MAG: ATP-binding protein [Candidatus Komeilibacteria bacterium]
MSLAELLPLISAILVFVLGIFVLFKDVRSGVNRIFFLFTLAATVWLYGTYKLFTVAVSTDIIFWDRFIYTGITIVPALGYHFSLLVTRQRDRRSVIILAYVWAIFFFIISRTPYFVDGVFIYNWGAHTRAQFWHHIFLAYFAIFFSILFYNIYHFSHHTTSGRERVQARYMLAAFGILIGIGSLGFLPAYGISIYPFAYVSGVLFVVILAYAIIKHRFMNIRLIIKQSTVFISSIIATIGISYFIYNLLIWNWPRIHHWELLALLIALLILQPIRNWFGNIANRYFFADIYNYQEVLRELSHHLTAIIDLDEVVGSIVGTMSEAFRLEKIGVLLCGRGKTVQHKCDVVQSEGFQARELRGLLSGEWLVKYLEMTRSALLTDDIPIILRTLIADELKDKLLQWQAKMTAAGASVCVPLLKEGKLIGVMILGQKLSRESFSNEDLELIDTVSNQASVAIDNALLYQQVKDFNAQLQDKIRVATKNLQRTNSKLKYANANLQQLDEAKSEFLSIASHQLRTPLSGIKGYLSMLQEGDFGKLPPKIKTVIKELFTNADRMSRLINTFLNISRIEADRLVINHSPVNVYALTRDTWKDFRVAAKKKKLHYTCEVPRGSLIMSLDEDKIKDVLINFIDNAIKYTASGFVKVSAQRVKDNVRVEVSDSGVGIRQSDLDNLFEKFSRGKEIAKINTSGSGLGLYIARKIVEAHGGEVFVDSSGEGKGSTFGFRLPLTD